jgi:hypothetical protein
MQSGTVSREQMRIAEVIQVGNLGLAINSFRVNSYAVKKDKYMRSNTLVVGWGG